MIEMMGAFDLLWFLSERIKFNLTMMFSLLLLSSSLLSCFSLDTEEGMVLLKFRERVLIDPFSALSDWSSKDGSLDHCSWFGVVCSDGKVVVLNLKDLCLGGTLTPELGQLSSLKSIILRNNSFTGIIPSEIADLKELEVLDLGYNNFSGPVPFSLGNNFSLYILLLDNNYLLDILSPELSQLQMLSEHQVNENQLRGVFSGRSCNSEPLLWYASKPNNFLRRNLLTVGPFSNPFKPLHPSNSPSPFQTRSHSHSSSKPPFRGHPHLPPSSSPKPSPAFSPSPPPSLSAKPTPVGQAVIPSDPSVASVSPASAQAARVPVSSFSSTGNNNGSRSKHHKAIVWASVSGASAFLIVAAAVVVLVCRSSKMVTVKPWATGLSGQLQRALVSGVPKLKRAELDVACEDFSNIIGSLTDGTVYKGTLSSGIEIAVVASSVKSAEEWSKKLELQFRKKIETLSKVNHKNFVNLIGYCEEEKPFTRMMVFEYAPNGTLFEHLHIKEAERLDWKMRLRIVMGMAYCLDYMHQLDPPIPHRDLQSSAIYLSEDYATKISDFSFWNVGARSKMRSPSLQLLEATSTDIESNVFNFGVVLFEMITGRVPHMEDDCSLADWVMDLLEKDHIPKDFIDPTLSSYHEEDVQRMFNIIRDCVHPDQKERPTMRDIAARLREITGVSPDAAIPRLSPLWWAELEIMSTEGY